MAKERIHWIDWAKALTMVCVVFGHTSFRESDEIFRNFVYSFHVPMFFFLSGYLFFKKESFAPFLKKNVMSLLVPYFLLNLIVLVFMLPQILLGYDFRTVPDMIIYILTGNGFAPAGACWFLLCLFFVRIFSYFIVDLNKYIQVFILVISPIVAYTLLYVLDINLYFKIGDALVAIIPFICGYYCRIKDLINFRLNKLYSVILIVICAVIIFYIAYYQGFVTLEVFGAYPLLYFPQMFIGCSMMILISGLFKNIESKIVSTIGYGTMVILAFHGLLYYTVTFLLFGTDEVNGLAQPLAYNIIAAVVIVLIYYPIIPLVDKYCPILLGKWKPKA